MVVWFKDVGLADVAAVGGKNASLGEMIRELVPLGVRVPDGFAMTAQAFRWHLRQAAPEDWVYSRLDDLDITDPSSVAAAGAEIRERIAAAPLPSPIRDQVIESYRTLSCAIPSSQAGPGSRPDSAGSGQPDTERWIDVAVRSSATAEDLPTASFAGQHETFLNIRGPEALDAAVRARMASLFTDRAIVYRVNNKFDHCDVALSVGVQRMVRADMASPNGGCAGTMFALDTESGFRGVVMIDASWGWARRSCRGG